MEENLDPNHHRYRIDNDGAGASGGTSSALPRTSSLPLLTTHHKQQAAVADVAAGPLVMTPSTPLSLRRHRLEKDELTSSGIDWVDNVVDVATVCKKILTKHTCRLCQVYTDAQVEYEVRQEESARRRSYYNQQQQQQPQQAGEEGQTSSSSWPSHPAQQQPQSRSFYDYSSMLVPNALEVELYRQFLFDEDSVVETVNVRDKEKDEENDDENEDLEKDVTMQKSAITERMQ